MKARLGFTIVILLTLGLTSLVQAACTGSSPTWTSTGDFASLSTCVGNAVSGDTVNVLGGTHTYADGQTISPVSKWISIIGAGAGTDAECAVPSQTAKTCITRGSALNTDSRIFNWNTVPGGLSRISGMTLSENPASAASVSNRGTINLTGTSGTVRLDHIRFNIRLAPDLQVKGYVRGVVDHCEFDNRNGVNGSNTATIVHTSWLGLGANGDQSWNSPLTMGTAEALYFEDNTFWTGSGNLSALDGAGGSRVVIRFNEWNNVVISSGHGTETRERGSLQREVYNNTHNLTVSTTPMLGGRSGVQLVYDNRFITTQTGSLIEAANYFRISTPSQAASPWSVTGVRSVSSIVRSGTTVTVTTIENPHDLRNGAPVLIHSSPVAAYNDNNWIITGVPAGNQFTFTISGTPANDTSGLAKAQSPFDTTSTSNPSYPPIDLNCWGPGSILLSGTGGSTTVPRVFPNSTLVGCLHFNNLRGSPTPNVLIVSGINGAGVSNYVQNNREVWNQNTAPSCNTPGGNCTTGGGRGLIANRPNAASGGGCSSANGGVFYWATDQGTWRTQYGLDNEQGFPATTPFVGPSGKLYRCVSANTWQAWYGPNNASGEPLTYPHPLVGGSTPPPPPTPPAPPTGLHFLP